MSKDYREIWIELIKNREAKSCDSCRYFYTYPPNMPLYSKFDDTDLCGYDNHVPSLQELRNGCDNWGKEMKRVGR